MALASPALPADLSDFGAFVTLEPCSFHGRTASCARSLAERRIGAVYVGLVDPDPRNSGRGLALLHEAGVRLELGVLEQDIHEFLRQFLAGVAPLGKDLDSVLSGSPSPARTAIRRS